MTFILKQSDNYRKFYAKVTNLESWYSLEVGAFSNRKKSTQRGTSNISNAGILFITEYGSPLQNIPSRPVLKPALEDNKQQIKIYLNAIVLMKLQNISSYRINLLWHKLGKFLVSQVKRNIQKGGNPSVPLQPSTLYNRMRKGITNSSPLIETGQLYNAITYKLRYQGND